MWIQVRNSDDVVTRLGETKRSPRPDTTDYEVDSIPPIVEGEILKYDGTTFTVDPNTMERKMALEPALMAAYRKWQDAIALSLPCVDQCQAEYDAIQAQYDAI